MPHLRGFLEDEFACFQINALCALFLASVPHLRASSLTWLVLQVFSRLTCNPSFFQVDFRQFSILGFFLVMLTLESILFQGN